MNEDYQGLKEFGKTVIAVVFRESPFQKVGSFCDGFVCVDTRFPFCKSFLLTAISLSRFQSIHIHVLHLDLHSNIRLLSHHPSPQKSLPAVQSPPTRPPTPETHAASFKICNHPPATARNHDHKTTDLFCPRPLWRLGKRCLPVSLARCRSLANDMHRHLPDCPG